MQQRSYADGTAPELKRSIEAGDQVGQQIRNQQGPAYEKWLAGMNKYMSALNTTDSETSDTIPD